MPTLYLSLSHLLPIGYYERNIQIVPTVSCRYPDRPGGHLERYTRFQLKAARRGAKERRNDCINMKQDRVLVPFRGPVDFLHATVPLTLQNELTSFYV